MNVTTCFVCYIKTVFRLAYRTFFFTVCYSGLSVRLIIKIMLVFEEVHLTFSSDLQTDLNVVNSSCVDIIL